MYFENIFLLWPQLSILISKALLKEMAAREGANLAHGTGLGSEASSGSEWEGAEKGQQGREENKERKRAEELWEGQKLFSQGTNRRGGGRPTDKSSIVSVVPAISVAVLTSFISSAQHTKGLRVCAWVA